MAEVMNVYKKLLAVQSKIKCNKNQKNSFGNYNYRSCEDILEAVKPHLVEVKATIMLSDTIELVGDWHYVKATATFMDLETGNSIEVKAYAREEFVSGKKMDYPQFTGSSSSYARKYALNGMLLLDDSKDPDSDIYQEPAQNEPKKEEPKPQTKQLTKEDVDAREKLIAYCKENKINMAMVAKQYPEVASRGTKKVFDYVLSEISSQLTSLPEAWFLKEGK
ncbi:MAG: ERF family protein [Candidatus Onthovivens sp.]|nr:ERF family protein [Candidatus Onthovivens sp.]